jgi:hypothetical protein
VEPPLASDHDVAHRVFVVSALVRNAADPNDVLLGVRRPTSTSARHPGVLSTLTMRVSEAMFAAAVNEAFGAPTPYPAVGEVVCAQGAGVDPLGEPNGFERTSTFLAESLLARKVGLADALVSGALHGSVRPLGLASDVVEDPKGGYDAELTTMLTYLVEFDRASVSIPERTSSYDPIAWVNAADLARAVATHDALVLLPEANPWEVCLHGLCMHSAVDLLAASLAN